MRSRAAFTGLLTASFLLALFGHRSSGVGAGTAIRMDVGDLTQRADLILEAQVLSMQALEDPDGRIETEFLLEVADTFQGEDMALRAVRLPGGILSDGRGMLLAGMPGLEQGERVLLFLTAPGEAGLRMPVGLAQGKFRVVENPQGSKFLVRQQAGLALVGAGTRNLVEADGVSVFDFAEVRAQIIAAQALTATSNDVR